ncbi:MAG TPA: hypothetical protein VF974_07420 [Patescibacteria group bacterium]
MNKEYKKRLLELAKQVEELHDKTQFNSGADLIPAFNSKLSQLLGFIQALELDGK